MTQHSEPAEAAREDIAKIVYSAMKWAAERAENGKPPAWVERGNSLAQTEARRFASDIAALAAPAATSGEPVGWVGDVSLGYLKAGKEGKIYPTEYPSTVAVYTTPLAPVESEQVKEAVRLALEWDERRSYIMPYRVRDKLRASLATDAEG